MDSSNSCFGVFFCFLAVFLSSLSAAQKVPAMYVFGDSLVDVGNNNHLDSVLKADFPHNGIDYPTHKPTGRFSNGLNSADFLAEKVGLQTPPPYLSNRSGVFLKGASFASGGAGILNNTNSGFFAKTIPLTTQVDYFTTVYGRLVNQLGAGGAQQHLAKSLFPVVIGSNDMFVYFKSGKSKLKATTTPQQYVDQMLSTLQTQLKRLQGLGARKLIMVGLGPVGCVPSQRSENQNEECNDQTNYWSNKYNQGLKSMLSNLKDLTYSYFEIYPVFLDLVQNPSSYGFSEVKAACCGLGKLNAKIPCTPVSTYCPIRKDHLFWDFVHPTEAAARIFIDKFFDSSKQYAVPIGPQELLDL